MDDPDQQTHVCTNTHMHAHAHVTRGMHKGEKAAVGTSTSPQVSSPSLAGNPDVSVIRGLSENSFPSLYRLNELLFPRVMDKPVVIRITRGGQRHNLMSFLRRGIITTNWFYVWWAGLPLPSTLLVRSQQSPRQVAHILSLPQAQNTEGGDRGSTRKVYPMKRAKDYTKHTCPFRTWLHQPQTHENTTSMVKYISKFHLPSVAKYSRWHSVSSIYFESFESLSKMTLSCKIEKPCDWQSLK